MCGYLVKSFLLVHKKTTIVFKKKHNNCVGRQYIIKIFYAWSKKMSRLGFLNISLQSSM